MRLKLKQIALAALLATWGASVLATNYFYVQPKSINMSKTSPLSVALNPSALPDAVVGLPYNGGAGFDLKSVLSVSGDSGFNASLTTFNITSGTLPTGLTVSATGVLSGTPTVPSAGSNIQVTATYKTVSGVQSYQVISLNLTVTLAAATLPPANVGVLYNGTGFDFKPVLSVTGDATYNAGQALFTLAGGSNALPAGLELSNSGVLTGTPSAITAGASFTVQASYKTKTGQQAYTIVVGGAVLQVLQVAAGDVHACALTTLGGVKCWGYGEYGGPGTGFNGNESTPIDVPSLTSGVVSLTAGYYHNCAVTTAGGVKCWGLNTDGQLGNGSTQHRTSPLAVSGLTSGVASVSAGYGHTCALMNTGGLTCWGRNTAGQLGDGTISNRLTPVAVPSLSGVASVFAGQMHTCAVTTAGGLKCWGADANGQLGNDAALTDKLIPVDVSGLTSGVASGSSGQSHTCAVTTSGALKCWGLNTDGRLGDNTRVSRPTPVDVAGLAAGVSRVSAGQSHTCAVTTSGAVKCWGSDGFGQLGNDTSTDSKLIPVDVLGLTSGAVSVSTSRNTTYAVMNTGELKSWGGDSYGQLGDDSVLAARPTPVHVAK